MQKNELENLSEDDYRKLNLTDIESLGLDEIDNYYYYHKVEYPDAIKDKLTREEREKIYFYRNHLKELVLEMCKKNGNWSLLVYGDTISGYNQKEGLLEDFDYIEIEASEIVGSDDYGGYVDVTAKNNEEERVYRVNIGIEDRSIQSIQVKLGDRKVLKANQELDIRKLRFDKDHTKDNFNNLCKYESAYKGGIDWNGDDIGITEHFYSKYQFFLDIFVHYSPLEYNKITLKELDIENQTAKFEVDSVLECKKRTYEVKYMLNENGYLDDVKVELLNVNAYVGNKDERTNKVLYRYSNWDNLNLTVNFLDKYNSDVGLLPNIDEINIDIKIK